MIGIYSIILGFLVVIISLGFIRKEFKNSFFLIKGKNSTNSDGETEKIVENMEEIINSMNEAFYDLVGDIEGKISYNDFEIENLKKEIATANREIIGLKTKLNNIDLKNFNVEEKEMYIDSFDFKKNEETIESVEVKDKIILLRSKGMSVSQIARELGLGIGEINLILNMKK